MQATVRCPICGKQVSFNDPNSPFCGDRCRIIDLGNWASEKYVISEPAAPGDFDITPAEEQDEGPIQ